VHAHVAHLAKHINMVGGPLCPSLNPALPVLLLMVYFRHNGPYHANTN